jgi:hypothetical protein
MQISSADDGTGHTCGFEFVPSMRRPRTIYVVFDGVRIARRWLRKWLPIVDGYAVEDEAPNAIVVYFDGERMH